MSLSPNMPINTAGLQMGQAPIYNMPPSAGGNSLFTQTHAPSPEGFAKLPQTPSPVQHQPQQNHTPSQMTSAPNHQAGAGHDHGLAQGHHQAHAPHHGQSHGGDQQSLVRGADGQIIGRRGGSRSMPLSKHLEMALTQHGPAGLIDSVYQTAGVTTRLASLALPDEGVKLLASIIQKPNLNGITNLSNPLLVREAMSNGYSVAITAIRSLARVLSFGVIK